MLANEIKKGAIVRTNDGVIYEVKDNARGIIRMCRNRPDLGSVLPYDEMGSVYAFHWFIALIDGTWHKVEIPASWEAKVKAIKAAGF